MIDATMPVKDALSGCPPSQSSHLTISLSATTISASIMTTGTLGSTTTSTPERKRLPCKHCPETFLFGKDSRSRQAITNLRRHMRECHADALPKHQLTLYGCGWGCSYIDSRESNVETHERKFCSKITGNTPRSRIKRQQTPQHHCDSAFAPAFMNLEWRHGRKGGWTHGSG